MNQPRKTKKIEIEVYEDEEVDFLLSLINSYKNNISKEQISQRVFFPYINYKFFWESMQEPVYKETKKTVRNIWRHFKVASKHKSSQMYKELVGENFVSFYNTRISYMLWVIFSLWHGMKILKVQIKPEDKQYFLASLSNLIFNYFTRNVKVALDNMSDKDDVEAWAEKIWNSNKFGENGEYEWHENKTIILNNIYTRNDIYCLLNGMSLIVEQGQQQSKENQQVEFLIIEFLYQELKSNYNFSNHVINIIIGYILAKLGFLHNQETYDELNKEVTWNDYVKSNIENKIKNKNIVDRDKIVFVGKPFLEKKSEPLNKELYSNLRELAKMNRKYGIE